MTWCCKVIDMLIDGANEPSLEVIKILELFVFGPRLVFGLIFRITKIRGSK